MSKKNNNPYKAGSAYHKGFDVLRKAGQKGISKADLAAQAGISEHDAQVVLSPNALGEGRGDCRGNMSAAGHLYFTKARTPKTQKDRRKPKDANPSFTFCAGGPTFWNGLPANWMMPSRAKGTNALPPT